MTKPPTKAKPGRVKAPAAAQAARTPATRRSRPGGPAELPQDVLEDLEGFQISPLRWMLGVVNDPSADPVRRDRMAASAAQYMHRRMADGGMKAQREAAATKVANTGRFKPGATPRALRGDRDD